MGKNLELLGNRPALFKISPNQDNPNDYPQESRLKSRIFTKWNRKWPSEHTCFGRMSQIQCKGLKKFTLVKFQ